MQVDILILRLRSFTCLERSSIMSMDLARSLACTALCASSSAAIAYLLFSAASICFSIAAAVPSYFIFLFFFKSLSIWKNTALNTGWARIRFMIWKFSSLNLALVLVVSN